MEDEIPRVLREASEIVEKTQQRRRTVEKVKHGGFNLFLVLASIGGVGLVFEGNGSIGLTISALALLFLSSRNESS